jgi:hypothetical protein
MQRVLGLMLAMTWLGCGGEQPTASSADAQRNSDLAAARAEATAQGKGILLLFTGTTW